MKMQLHSRLALVAAVAFVLPPLVASSEPLSAPALLTHRYVAGEHFVYDSRTVVNSAQLKTKRPGRYTLDVDAHDPARAMLRIEHEGKVNPPIPIAIKPDGTWTRPDGLAVPAFPSYDANLMCRHGSTAVHVGDTWDCHVDGVSQYLGAAPTEAGDVHVSVVKVTPSGIVELNAAFKGQPRRTTVVDDVTHADVEVAQQTLRVTDVVLENGVVTSIADHSHIGTTAAGSTTVMDVVATKNLVEHRVK